MVYDANFLVARENYCIQVYFKFIQHKSSRIACNSFVSTFLLIWYQNELQRSWHQSSWSHLRWIYRRLSYYVGWMKVTLVHNNPLLNFLVLYHYQGMCELSDHDHSFLRALNGWETSGCPTWFWTRSPKTEAAMS